MNMKLKIRELRSLVFICRIRGLIFPCEQVERDISVKSEDDNGDQASHIKY